LTESELHNLIKETVTQILHENEMYNINEGPLDFFKSLGRQGKSVASDQAKKMGKYVNNKTQQVNNYVTSKKNQIGGYVNSMKNGINQGIQNARQDSAMADMKKAYNNFAQAVDRYSQSNGEVGKVLKGAMTKINNILSRYQNHQ
jgi:hypothetical protein